jgi:2-octaprenyl-6-methoxyphenol hydroxylase
MAATAATAAAEGITELAPAAIAGIDYDSTGAVVRLEDGRRLAAPLVVACDGRRSPVAAAAGIRRLRWSYGQTGLVNAIAHELPHRGVAHQSFFPGGPFAVLPLPGNRSSLVWSERTAEAERLQALDDATFTAEIAARIGDRLGRIELIGRRWAYPLDLTLAERYVAPRLALAGDAAHGVHPIAGQGMNIGLRDVAALAEVLVEAARIGEDIGAPMVLERYQSWRRFDATALALGMDAMNRLFSNRDPALRLARDAGLAAVNRMGWLRRAFMREAAGMTGAVPRLLKGQAL